MRQNMDYAYKLWIIWIIHKLWNDANKLWMYVYINLNKKFPKK